MATVSDHRPTPSPADTAMGSRLATRYTYTGNTAMAGRTANQNGHEPAGGDDCENSGDGGGPFRMAHCVTAVGRRRAFDFMRNAAKEFKADRGGMVAAGMAFYWFLAVFPALLALIGILGLVGLDGRLGSLIPRALEAALPGSASEVLDTALREADKGTGSSILAVLIGISLSLWAGTAGMVALQRGLDMAYEVKVDRTFVKGRLIGIILLGATAVLGGVATAAIVFGKAIGGGIREYLPFGAAFVPLWTVGRWLIGLLALGALFTIFYRVAPNRESRLPVACSPGSVIATLGWIAASIGFSFYVSSTGTYAQTYGSLTGVVVLLLWLYLSANAIVFGAEVNNEWEADAARRASPQRVPTA